MSEKKIITVFGATGAQGGGIVSEFLTNPELREAWAVRAVTRDLSKDSAKALATAGAEVVRGNLDDRASLVKAMTGATAAFGVTNYWEKVSAEIEIQQGKNLADAAKEAGVQHYIWSSLLNIKELSKGSLPNVYHFDSKAKVEDYVREIGIPASFFLAGFYMANFRSEAGFFKKTPPDNAFTLAMPVTPTGVIPMYHAADTGKYVKAILQNRDTFLGKRLLGATAYMTAEEVLDTFKRVFPEAGRTARYIEVPEKEYREAMASKGAPDFVATEMYENLKLLDTFGYYGGESLQQTEELVKDHLTTWEEYLKEAPEFRDLK